jgi:hypothetical protein
VEADLVKKEKVESHFVVLHYYQSCQLEVFTMFLRNCAFIYLLSCTATAFMPAKLPAPIALRNNNNSVMPTSSASSLIILSETEKKGGLDGKVRSKLLSESIAPWRTLRLFFYGSLGSGAFIGGLINTSGAIAGSNSPDFNLNTEVSTSNSWDCLLEKMARFVIISQN